MSDDRKVRIQSVYDLAVERVVPDGWFVWAATVNEAAEEMGESAVAPPGGPILVYLVSDQGMAHEIAEHQDAPKRVHAERHLANGYRDHPHGPSNS